MNAELFWYGFGSWNCVGCIWKAFGGGTIGAGGCCSGICAPNVELKVATGGCCCWSLN